VGKKHEVYRKIRRTVQREKKALVEQIAREMLDIPLWGRVKLAYRIVFKGKLFS